MNVSQAKGGPVEFECDGLVLGLGSDWESSRMFSAIDKAMNGVLSELMESDELSTKANKTTTFLRPAGIKARQLTIVGLGSIESRDAGIGYRAAATAAKSMASSKSRRRIAYAGFAGDELFLKSSVVGSITGGVGQDLFRAERSLHAPDEIFWFDCKSDLISAGQAIGESMNLATTRQPASQLSLPGKLCRRSDESGQRSRFGNRSLGSSKTRSRKMRRTVSRQSRFGKTAAIMHSQICGNRFEQTADRPGRQRSNF